LLFCLRCLSYLSPGACCFPWLLRLLEILPCHEATPPKWDMPSTSSCGGPTSFPPWLTVRSPFQRIPFNFGGRVVILLRRALPPPLTLPFAGSFSAFDCVDSHFCLMLAVLFWWRRLPLNPKATAFCSFLFNLPGCSVSPSIRRIPLAFRMSCSGSGPPFLNDIRPCSKRDFSSLLFWPKTGALSFW